MMTPLPDQDNDSLGNFLLFPSPPFIFLTSLFLSPASHSTQSTTTSTKTKGSEYVCFTINRGDGRPDEKWLEIVDTATSLKYYFNPQTGSAPYLPHSHHPLSLLSSESHNGISRFILPSNPQEDSDTPLPSLGSLQGNPLPLTRREKLFTQNSQGYHK
jgi:hypothetical protein